MQVSTGVFISFLFLFAFLWFCDNINVLKVERPPCQHPNLLQIQQVFYLIQVGTLIVSLLNVITSSYNMHIDQIKRLTLNLPVILTFLLV